MRYGVDMGVVYEDHKEWTSINDVARTILGDPESSGSGFFPSGSRVDSPTEATVRDMQWYYPEAEQAEIARHALEQGLIGAGLTIEYVSTFEEPETADEMREHGWDEGDIQEYFDSEKGADD